MVFYSWRRFLIIRVFLIYNCCLLLLLIWNILNACWITYHSQLFVGRINRFGAIKRFQTISHAAKLRLGFADIVPCEWSVLKLNKGINKHLISKTVPYFTQNYVLYTIVKIKIIFENNHLLIEEIEFTKYWLSLSPIAKIIFQYLFGSRYKNFL